MLSSAKIDYTTRCLPSTVKQQRHAQWDPSVLQLPPKDFIPQTTDMTTEAFQWSSLLSPFWCQMFEIAPCILPCHSQHSLQPVSKFPCALSVDTHPVHLARQSNLQKRSNTRKRKLAWPRRAVGLCSNQRESPTVCLCTSARKFALTHAGNNYPTVLLRIFGNPQRNETSGFLHVSTHST